MRRIMSLAMGLVMLVTSTAGAADVRVTLRGSRASMVRQNQAAKANDFSFKRTESEIEKAVAAGRLVQVPGNDAVRVIAKHPVARPEVKLFIERLGRQYRDSCGEQLVVTSLTRPMNRQPRNASPLSVHPAGMAVDLRISQDPACRSWLREALLGLERQGVLDATEERNPPHFHVALFPQPYASYVDRKLADSVRVAEAERQREAAAAARPEATGATVDRAPVLPSSMLGPVASASAAKAEVRRAAARPTVKALFGLWVGYFRDFAGI